MHDKFKKRHRVPEAGDRARRQIAREAARRLLPNLAPQGGKPGVGFASEADLYAAKRRAAAVLGHAVRPGDLPTDAEVREEIARLALDRDPSAEEEVADEDEEEPAPPKRMADHVDRFAIYKMRLEPLATVKQNAKWHPEGDALYHSLQVFENARAARPYDEEFLTAALLHDVGKAIDPFNHVQAGLAALEGTITLRVAWLIEHHMDLLARSERPLSPKIKALIEVSEHYEDLVLLRDCDNCGRQIGVVVPTVEEALALLRGLESEAYLADE